MAVFALTLRRSMRSRSAKSNGGPNVKALKAIEQPPNDKTFHLLKWHAGEPHESWWLNLDRDAFIARASVEAPRIASSSMARRISRGD